MVKQQTKTSLCLLLLLVFFTLTDARPTTWTIYRGDVYMLWTHRASDLTLKIGSRNLNGYQSISFRKFNGTSNDTLTMVSYGGKTKYFLGANVPKIITSPVSNRTSFVEGGWTNVYNFAYYYYYLNKQSFINFYGFEKVYVDLAINLYTMPTFDSKGNIYPPPTAVDTVLLNLNSSRAYDTQKLTYFGRFENLHPAIYSISAVIHIIILVLAIIFLIFKLQPIKSHGYLPIIVAVVQLVRVLHDWFYFSPIQLMISYYCYIELFVKYPSILSILLVIPLNQLRFIILFHLNYQKSLFISKKDGKKRLRLSIIILKILSKDFIMPIIVVSFYAFISAFYLIYALIMGINSCQNIQYLNIHSFIYFSFLVLIVFFIVVILIVDISFLVYHVILKVKKKPLELWQKILFPIHVILVAVKEDVYYFRFQVYVIGFISASLELPTILTIFFVSLAEYGFLFMFTGFFIIMSIVRLIYKSCSKPPKQDVNFLEDLFKDKDGTKGFLLDQFSQFANEEFSGENVACYKDIFIYKQIKDEKKRQEKYEQMHQLYFNGVSSELEINASSGSIKDYKARIAEGLDDKLYTKIEKDVVYNLSDTWSRFIVTREYQEFKYKEKLQSDLQGGNSSEVNISIGWINPILFKLKAMFCCCFVNKQNGSDEPKEIEMK
eukprot:gene12297-5880_t